MIFKCIPVGSIEANCYIIGCPETRLAVVVDSGDEGRRILSHVQKHGLRVLYIINTHGHLDHIGANGAVKEATGAQILIHSGDAPMLTDPALNFSKFMGHPIAGPPADRLVQDGDVLQVGTLRLNVIHTPGHTPGGICLLIGDHLITGDTLFAGSIGRTDFPGGSHETLIESIKEKLLILPDETRVYPGHGPESTIGEEREGNPFLL